MSAPGIALAGLGAVAPAQFTTGPERPLRLRSGAQLAPVTQVYETYGTLDAERSNAILLFHALSGSQHAAGYCEAVPEAGERWTEECAIGWWDGFVGPGRALDTNRYCVICANYVGGCYGSTGPASIDPATGRPYGSRFPRLSLADIVDAQVRLLDHLGIRRLHAAIGASLGGLLCLSLATRYPDRVGVVVPIAAGVEVTPLQRLHNLEQIVAIRSDAAFHGGDYYDGPGPALGLALARMIAHKTYVSLHTLDERARLEVVQPDQGLAPYRVHHPLESYILHQGRKFVRRFDANTYLRITEAWQGFNLAAEGGTGTLDELFGRCRKQRYLIFTIDSDVCFYPEEQEELARLLKEAGVRCMRITVHSEKGHDAFLLEPELFTPHLAYALNAGSE